MFTDPNSRITKWPNALRWLLVVPCAVGLPILLIVIQILTSTFMGWNVDAPYYKLLVDGIVGACFVYGAVWMAPSKHLVVAIVCFSFILLMSGYATLAQPGEDGGIFHLIRLFVTVFAAGCVLYEVAKKSNQSTL